MLLLLLDRSPCASSSATKSNPKFLLAKLRVSYVYKLLFDILYLTLHCTLAVMNSVHSTKMREMPPFYIFIPNSFILLPKPRRLLLMWNKKLSNF